MNQGDVLDGKWKILDKIGQGTFASVYSVENVDKSKVASVPLVAKCISTGRGLSAREKKDQERICNSLNREYQLLAPGKQLTEFPYRPLPKPLTRDYYGEDEAAAMRYLVIEKLDENIFEWSKSNPSSNEVASIGLELLDGLRWLHRKGWHFVDIKPENFMLRHNHISLNRSRVVFIDCTYAIISQLCSQYLSFNFYRTTTTV